MNKCADIVADLLVDNIILRFGMSLVIHSDQGREFENGLTVQITFILIGPNAFVFGKRVCTCVMKHSNAFRTFLNWLKNSKRVLHEPKLHISRLPLFAHFDL